MKAMSVLESSILWGVKYLANTSSSNVYMKRIPDF